MNSEYFSPDQTPEINELTSALCLAQMELESASEENVNPHFKSKYADLNSCWKACRSVLGKYGLCVFQCMKHKNDRMYMVTTLAHKSGQWIRSESPLLMEKNTSQALGSACTYMRRYQLSAIVGITTGEDDDGNAASSSDSENKSRYNKYKPCKNLTNTEINHINSTCDIKFINDTLKFFEVKDLSQISSENYTKILKWHSKWALKQ